MKKQICSLALCTLFGLSVAVAAPQDQQAAPANPPAAHHQIDPNRQVQMLSKRLNLTADQQNQILPILTQRDQQMQAIRSDSSLSAQDRRAKMREVREQSDSQIKGILNDQQKAGYDQMQQQMRERNHERRQEQQQNAAPGSGTPN